jgi:hypothetical protein
MSLAGTTTGKKKKKRKERTFARDRQTTLEIQKTEAKPNRNLRRRLTGDSPETHWKHAGV